MTHLSERPTDNYICVDAGCRGNPGPCEYRGVDNNGKVLFHIQVGLGTNNIAEFLAIVHGLAWLKREGLEDYILLSDSVIALKWVKNAFCGTNTEHGDKAANLIDRAEDWLENNPQAYEKAFKWQTKPWGENPADFGRKPKRKNG